MLGRAARTASALAADRDPAVPSAEPAAAAGVGRGGVGIDRRSGGGCATGAGAYTVLDDRRGLLRAAEAP